MDKQGPKRFYRYSQLVDAGVINNRMTLSRLILNEGFPAGVELAPNCVGYPADEVDRWLENRPTRRPSLKEVEAA